MFPDAVVSPAKVESAVDDPPGIVINPQGSPLIVHRGIGHIPPKLRKNGVLPYRHLGWAHREPHAQTEVSLMLP